MGDKNKASMQLQNAAQNLTLVQAGQNKSSFKHIASLEERFYSAQALTPITNRNVLLTAKKLLLQRLFLAQLKERLEQIGLTLAFVSKFTLNPQQHHDYLFLWASVLSMAAKVPKNAAKLLSDEQLIGFAKSIRETSGMGKRSELKLVSRQVYGELIQRSKAQRKNFFELAGFGNKNESKWSDMVDKELLKETLRFIRINGIKLMTDLQDAKGTPYWELYRRDKAQGQGTSVLKQLRESLESPRRNLSAMTSKELIAEAERIIREIPSASIQQFAKADPYLVGKLVERGIDPLKEFKLIDESKKAGAPAQEQRAAMLPKTGAPSNIHELYPELSAEAQDGARQYMDWKGMKSEKEITDFIWNVMYVNGLTLTQLRKSPDFAYCYEKARDLGVRHILQEKTKRMGLRFIHKTEEDERIDFSLMDTAKLLRYVEKNKIKNREELLHYTSLCIALDKNGILNSVMERLSQNGNGSMNRANGNGNGRKNGNGKRSGNLSNITELYPKAKTKGRQRKAA